jgi:D-xylulose reductase
VISGCGPLGLLIIAVAKACAVRRIIVFDIEESRVNFACQYGAHVGIVAPQFDRSIDSLTNAENFTSEVIREQGLDYGVDVAIEASGAEICAQMAVTILKPGGTCTKSCLLIALVKTLTVIQVSKQGWGNH